jgi:hypothetical protein
LVGFFNTCFLIPRSKKKLLNGIPIHTLSEGSISLPISLSYHAGGLKVGEHKIRNKPYRLNKMVAYLDGVTTTIFGHLNSDKNLLEWKIDYQTGTSLVDKITDENRLVKKSCWH